MSNLRPQTYFADWRGLESSSRLIPDNSFSFQTSQGDIRDIKVTAFQLVEHMDISVFVESTIPEHLRTLKLKLCKDEMPDSPVHVVKLDTLAGGTIVRK